ncbi:MAG: kelch repeat-containing protein [Bacteroidota bacterium]
MKRNTQIAFTILLCASAVFLLSSLKISAQGNGQYLPFELDVNGTTRRYTVYVPEGHDGTEEWPMVIQLHGLNSNINEQIKVSQMYLVADTAKFLITYPRGLYVYNKALSYGSTGWNVPDVYIGNQDDVAFIDKMISDIDSNPEITIDLDRIHATGWSNGGQMSFYLACVLPHQIASVAAVAAQMSDTMISHIAVPSRQISVLHMQGTDDFLFPKDGDEWNLPIEGAAEFWAGFNGCHTIPDTTFLPDIHQDDNSTVTLLRYSTCHNNTEVLSYHIEGGGHTWPGGWIDASWTHLGVLNKDIIASAEIWNFFKRNPRPSNVILPDCWEQMKPMDIAKGGSVSCIMDGMIYVFGGANSSLALLNSAEVFNAGTNEWSNLVPMPTDLYESNAEVINHKIYLVGGWHDENNLKTSNRTFEYNPEGESWIEKKDFPVSTGTNSSCVLNDKLYILGGLRDFADEDTSGQKEVFVYDPETDTWDTIPMMLYERGEGSSACVYDGKIYIFGGLHAISESSEKFYITGKAEMYDPALNMWTELADMPVPVVNHISMVYNNKLYVCGGDSGTFTTSRSYGTNIIQEYNPSTNSWRLMQGMPFTRTNMTGQKVGNYLYIFGGYPSSRDFKHPSREVWRFNLECLEAWNYVAGISLDKHSMDIEVDGIGVIVAKVNPANASDSSVFWSSGDSDIAVVDNGNVTGVGAGQTYIYVTTNDGSFKDSCQVTVTLVGIANTMADRLSIFPNPTRDLLTIQTEFQGAHSIEISSLNGQQILVGEMEGTTHQIDILSFQKGVYFITIRSKDFVTTRKIIKL